MPDYNIYIHADTSTAGSNPTKPKERSIKATAPKVASAKTETSLLKTAVGVGVSFIVSKKAFELAKYAVDTSLTFYTSLTGDFRYETNWNNFKNTIRVLGDFVNPAKLPNLIISGIQNQVANQKAFYKAQEQAKLTGDSIVNYYNNLGV